MSEQKTVRVRIAVAVNTEMFWAAVGDAMYPANDARLAEAARNELNRIASESEVAVHFIEAEIPIPQPQTIAGTVSEPTP